MCPIQDAIEEIESCAPDTPYSYRALATKHGCSRSTLSRKHQMKTKDYAGANPERINLSPQQELELVKYIEGLSTVGLSRTRAIIRNFGTYIAKKPCSERWVSRFLKRNSDNLTIKFSKGMDRNRHVADSGDKYQLYFELLHSKIREYDIDPRYIYNIDEKGFLISILARLKRVFSKAK
jgi:transposase-like protein